MTAGADVRAGARRPWARAALWLAGVGPFFFLTYGLANWLALRHPNVESVVYSWERGLPFWPWTIVPYWSIDGFYAASLFVCATGEELDRHGRRLLTAQVAAVTCFIAWPLRFGFERPELSGPFGALFGLLTHFDGPFNQAPSLHIALLVILWDLYARRTPGRLLWGLHLWFALIGVSVLTTYQHHFIDVPTGALLGLVSLWLWPLAGPTPAGALTRDPRRRSLAIRYALGAAGLAAMAAWARGVALWLLWPATSLALVAGAYAFFGPGLFQKAADGTVSPAVRWLLAPYRLAAWINSRLWAWRGERIVAVADGLHLARMPARVDAARWGRATLVDVSAELIAPRGFERRIAVPMLDLVRPDPTALRAAALAADRALRLGPVIVCCALGYSRSAAVVATWLLATGRAASLEEAVDRIRAVRPAIVLDETICTAIREATP
jgi:membrane-associated phospholipid phosphatase/predicted protein tyrosine phosphatase